jgi:hypothetical protein
MRLPRNLGQHSGGMVICQGHLSSIVPIERASMEGRTVVQWDKDDCSNMGIVKIDVLGLGMPAVLSDCRELVPKYYGTQLDYAQIPQDDAVYTSIAEADTIGLFQIESRARMSALPRTKPKCFTDLSMQVAIIRPGPVTGKFVNPYIERGEPPNGALTMRSGPILLETYSGSDLKLLKPSMDRVRFLMPQMILLDNVVKVLRRSQFRSPGQQAVYSQLADGSMRSRIAVDGDRMWRPLLMPDRFLEGGLGRGYIACSAESEVNGLPGLVHCSVGVHPVATHLDVGLIDAPRAGCLGHQPRRRKCHRRPRGCF